MPNLDMLDTMEDRVRLDEHLLARWRQRVKALRAARARDRVISFEGQMTLAREFRLVMPLRASRLPIPMRGVLSDVMPIPPARVKRCLRCGGDLSDDGHCTSGRFVWAKVRGRYMDTRCQAVWPV
jgi:hypothetical protein